MVRLLCATAVAIAALMLDQRPVVADEAPWCAVHSAGFGGAYWDCQYRSVEECVPNVIAGNRGFCNPNPRYHGVQKPERKRATRRHTRQKHNRQ